MALFSSPFASMFDEAPRRMWEADFYINTRCVIRRQLEVLTPLFMDVVAGDFVDFRLTRKNNSYHTARYEAVVTHEPMSNEWGEIAP
jgi:hypothetical protein